MNQKKIEFLRWHIQNIYERHPMVLKDAGNEASKLIDWKETGKPVFTEIEIFTGNTSASAFQIVKTGYLTVEPLRVTQELKEKSIFDIATVAEWYQETDDCPKMMAYVEMIDYWRLRIVEYLDEISR